jgi:hypothetical protein
MRCFIQIILSQDPNIEIVDCTLMIFVFCTVIPLSTYKFNSKELNHQFPAIGLRMYAQIYLDFRNPLVYSLISWTEELNPCYFTRTFNNSDCNYDQVSYRLCLPNSD